jgi:hypothetical protein
MGSKWICVLALGLLATGPISALAASGSHSSAISDDPSLYIREGASKTYNDEVTKAVKLRNKGDLKGALEAFSAAADSPISEIPNYEIWADISDLYCRLGKKREGVALIKEFSCAVDVMSSRKQCWINSESSLEIPNKSVLPLCYRTVCNREYEDQYWQGQRNPALQPRFRRLRTLASQVEMSCNK